MVLFRRGASLQVRPIVGRHIAAVMISAGLIADLGAQGLPAPIAHVSMDDAVRLTLGFNQALRAQRLTIDLARADETTAEQRPKFNVTFGAEGFPTFSKRQLTWNSVENLVSYSGGLGYTFERGGRRDKRITVARDSTEVTRLNVIDSERQTRFQAEQAFIATLLAKSTLELVQQDLKSFSEVVDVNQERVKRGDLAEGEFYKISLQRLQFEQDVSAAEVGVIQAKAALRQQMGFETIADEFEIDGELAFTRYTLNLDDLKRQALESRPDVLAAKANVQLAQDTVALETANRARDVGTALDYAHTGPDNTMGVAVSFDLPFGDRNQGNIAHSEIAVNQAIQAEAATRFAAVTDVVNAYAAFETNQKILTLYQSGYLEQARKSLEITTYVYQHGAGTILDLLEAERTYRATELAYRESLAAYMTSLRQLNFAVGKQVIP